MLEEPALRTAMQPVVMPTSGDDVATAVDIDGAAGDAMGERRCEISAGPAHVHDVDQLAERRLLGGLVQQQLEVLQARGGARLERTGREGVNADTPGAA